MKTSELDAIFDTTFLNQPVSINTKIQVETEQGPGLMTYRGILTGYDNHMVYLGLTEESSTNAIMWQEVASVELLDLDAEAKDILMKKEPASGAIS